MATAARSNLATKARALNVLQLQEGLNNLCTKSIYIGLGDKDGLEICVPETNGYHRTNVRLSDFLGTERSLRYLQGDPQKDLSYDISMPIKGHPYFPRMLLAYTSHNPNAELIGSVNLATQDVETKAEQNVVINILGNWVIEILKKKLRQAWDPSYFDVYDTRE